MPRSPIVRELTAARNAFDNITEALATGDPRASYEAVSIAIRRLLTLQGEILGDDVTRIQRRHK